MDKVTILWLVMCVMCSKVFKNTVANVDGDLIRLTKEEWGKRTSDNRKDDDNVKCAFRKNMIERPMLSFMECQIGYSCFNMVYLSVNQTLNVVKQGCWPDFVAAKTEQNCEEKECVFPDLDNVKSNHSEFFFLSFCCCTGHLCNDGNFQLETADVRAKTVFTSTTKSTVTSKYTKSTLVRQIKNSTLVLTMMVSIATLVFFVVCLVLFYCWKYKQKKSAPEGKQLSQVLYGDNVDDSCNIPTELLDRLLSGNLIHQGMHSAIRLGHFGDKTVAIKVFPPRSRKQWCNERAIYRTLGPHPNIAKFITCNQFHEGVSFEGIIVMTYYPDGSLLSYLRHHTLTWRHMIRLAHGIVNGLSFLHGESDNNSECTGKPGIAHQDLNSRNILVTCGGTCVLADFGFALSLTGSAPENFPVVGSPRYMAPEALDGSIVLTNWTSAMKQVDSYALGLVLWELSRRCHEICEPGAQGPECLLPYEEELGHRPSVQRVRQFVCINKGRPKFPNQWRKNDVTLTFLMRTIEECWDKDGDARLTPLCVLNRITQIQDTSSAEQLIYQETEKNPKLRFNDEFNEKPKRTSTSVLYSNCYGDTDSDVNDDEGDERQLDTECPKPSQCLIVKQKVHVTV